MAGDGHGEVPKEQALEGRKLMWITGNVELPDEVLDAHENGELVFFVGAGVSVEAPSNLPLFDGLAKALAKRASHKFSRRGGLDFFIGSLESLPQGFDVHHHARELIANPKSKFNPLHGAIVDLASIGRAFRVVTTNYDDHLASAAASATIAIPDTWYAPALPLGRDFAGLVHLHGSVCRPEEEIILTDRDFGHAYITDAWAARFLLPMFDRFTVVFVGYSHDDVIMRYLALGLPSRKDPTASRRFALTNDPTNPKWDYLGIRPIAYPVVGRDHSALVKAFGAWTDRARMGQVDHQARVQAIVAGATTLPLPDRDYLHARLRTPEGVRDFANSTAALSDERKLDWLQWIEDLPEFKTLFAHSDVSDAAALLGNWFARTFISSPALHGAALQTVQRLGQSMTTSLYRNATWVTEDLVKQDAGAGERWRAFLATSVHGQSAPLGTEFLLPFLPTATVPSTAVLRTALRPLLKLERRWFVDESEERTTYPDAKVTWNSEDYALRQHVQLAVQAAAAGDLALGGALEDALVAAYELLDAYHGERGWDALSHSRSAVEPHQQDDFREPVDAIIDGLRDYGVRSLATRPDLPSGWWATGRALLQRIALHLIAADDARTSDEKIQWLLDRADLYADNLKHESYQVLASAVEDASDEMQRRVLAAVEAGPDYREDLPERDRHFAYAKYNLLVWLTRSAPGWVAAREALAAIQAENPTFGAREHPDFDSWMSSGTWGGKTPMSTEEFIQALDSDVAVALNDLLARDYSERHFDRPEWRDALELVEQSIAVRPDLGILLWDETRDHDDLDGKREDLWRAITEGWAKAELGDTGPQVVERVASLVHDSESARAIGRFLLDQIRQQVNISDTPTLAAIRVIAHRLWREQGEQYSHPADWEVLSSVPLYLNDWPGFLAQYWGGEVDRRWRHHRDDWDGLSREEADALIELLGGPRDALDATQPAIAGELFFYFAADPTFTTEHILPLFGDSQASQFAWNPYLHHPRYNDKLLAAGLLDSMMGEWDRLESLGDDTLRYSFFSIIASVVSFAGISTRDRRRLLDASVLSSNGAFAAGFAEAVTRFVHEDGVDGAEVWQRWLGRHIERRLNGEPRRAEAEELARWADVVPVVGEFIPAATDLLGGRGIGLGERYFSRELPEAALKAYGTELVGFFADRVRNSTTTGNMTAYHVQELAATIRSAVGDAVLQPLVDAAAERGLDLGNRGRG